MEPFEAHGLWWVPGKDGAHQTSGKVSITSEGTGLLELYGRGLISFERIHIPVIHGDTNRGHCTLLNCQLKSHSIPSANIRGPANQHIGFRSLFRGEHVTPGFSAGFVTLTASHLQSWSQIATLKVLTSDQEAETNHKFGLYYDIRSSPLATLEDGTTIQIAVNPSLSMAIPPQMGAEHQFVIRLANPASFDEILDYYINPLVDFLTFATDHPSKVIKLAMFVADSQSETRPGPRDLMEVVRHDRIITTTADPGSHINEHILPFEDIVFSEKLPLWLQLARKLKGIHGLIFGLRYADDMTVEHRLLNSATAAEAFHRATFPSRRAPVGLSNEQTKIWLAQFPDSERALIKSRLNGYINEPSLSDRLSDLTMKAGVAFEHVCPNPEEWIRLIKRTRNDLTHQRGVLQVKMSPDQMGLLADSTALLVTICFLIDLQYSELEIWKNLDRSSRIRSLRNELHKWLQAQRNSSISEPA
jgi:hypothetical protein